MNLLIDDPIRARHNRAMVKRHKYVQAYHLSTTVERLWRLEKIPRNIPMGELPYLNRKAIRFDSDDMNILY